LIVTPQYFLKRLRALIEEAPKGNSMRQGRVILADKHSNVLGGIRRLLEDEVETVLMVVDEISLYHALENFNPDVVVADLSLPISTGTNIARVLKKNFPKIKVIILSIYDEGSVVDDVMASGVEGFVLKRRAVMDLIPAIREVLQGHKYISPDINVAS
jgi:DNA-binding NarL/FixJ family response regulator